MNWLLVHFLVSNPHVQRGSQGQPRGIDHVQVRTAGRYDPFAQEGRQAIVEDLVTIAESKSELFDLAGGAIKRQHVV